MIRSVVIFCSASDNISPLYFSEADVLAKEIAAKKIRIIYGGARVGIMGRIADTALKNGGEVVGVIPHYLAKPGIVHENLTELIVVDDLLDRKRKMLSLADAAIAAPGGMGTIDEITEIIALKQLQEHQKPIYFYNFLDFWRPMLDYFVELYERRMIQQNLDDLYRVYDRAEDLVEDLKTVRP
jgi:uncharacterized protein (TIGR00730 family)